jgi:hypothetical protein
MLGIHITKKQFLCMWAIQDLEWREYLAYSIICCNIQYHEPRGYGVLEFKVGYLGIYAIKYYYRLECDYRDYFHCH